MTMNNFSERVSLTDHKIWKAVFISAIERFQKRHKILPSYIVANEYTHSLIDLWVNVNNSNKENTKLTHFIYNGNFIDLVFDSTISDQSIELQYDAFFEMDCIKQKTTVRKQREKVAA